jgi:hypothetical protein
MSNQWVVEYHEKSDDPMDETPNSWWEVRKPNSPFPNYFIVEDVGDPTDGEHLAEMLNEREELLHKVAKYEEVFKHALRSAPSEEAVAGYTWAWKFDILIKKIQSVFKVGGDG